MDAHFVESTITPLSRPQPPSHDRSRHRRRLLALLVAPSLAGLALVLLLGGARPATAAGEVGNGTPESCTYDALIAAMQGAGLVTFNCGPLPHTIVITYPGGVQPLGGQHTTLDGGGLITLSGNDTQRLFHVFPNTYFTLTHITLADGYMDSPGGAIVNQGGLWLDDVTIRDSHAQTPTWGAGAIYNVPGAVLVMRNSTLRGNLSGGGGAIFNEPTGHVLIENSQLIDNQVVGGIWGGAIYNAGMLTAANSLFLSNIVSFTGAADVSVGGGALVNAPGAQATIANAVFSLNEAATWHGGAVLNFGALSLQDGLFEANMSGSGGGLYNQATATATGTTFSRNSGIEAGGAVFNDGGTLTLVTAALMANLADYGAGLYNSSGTANLIDSEVTGNSAALRGGGLYNEGAEGQVFLTEVTLNSNLSEGDGAGIVNYEGEVHLTSSTVRGNTSSGDGAAVWVDLGGHVSLNRTTVSGNTSRSFGGGLYIQTGSAHLANTTVSGNTAVYGGGGIYNNYSLSLINVTLSGNGSNDGGGLSTTPRATTSLTNTLLASSSSGGNCSGAITASKYSLSSDDSCQLEGPGDQNGVHPLLSGLGNYGGPTQTHLPAAGSPAVDAVPGTDVPTVDQRGLPRPQGGAIDIGAVERQPTDADLIPRLWLAFIRR